VIAVALAIILLVIGWQARSTEHRRIVVPGGDAGQGELALAQLGCGTCHTIPGVTGADGSAGPPLVRWSERTYIAGEVPNTPRNLLHWIMSPQSIEPGTAMPDLGVSLTTARDIAAYLYTLGDRDRSDR